LFFIILVREVHTASVLLLCPAAFPGAWELELRAVQSVLNPVCDADAKKNVQEYSQITPAASSEMEVFFMQLAAYDTRSRLARPSGLVYRMTASSLELVLGLFMLYASFF
jgi:hypothetical protein